MMILGALLIGNLTGCSMTTANREELKAQEEIERCNTENEIIVRSESKFYETFYKCELNPNGKYQFRKLTEQERNAFIIAEYSSIHSQEKVHQELNEHASEQETTSKSADDATRNHMSTPQNKQHNNNKDKQCYSYKFKATCKNNIITSCQNDTIISFDCNEEIDKNGKPSICVEFLDSLSDSAECISRSDRCSKVGKTITRKLKDGADEWEEEKANYRCEKSTNGNSYYHKIGLTDRRPKNSNIDLPF